MPSRAAILRAAGACARSPVISRLLRSFYRRRTNIVYYHGVWPTGSAPLALFYGIDLDTFRADMKTLCRHFWPVSLDEMLRANDASETEGKPLVAVTFDDGADLTRSGAADVLGELGIPATTFVVLACVDNRHLMWQHKFSAIRAMRGDDIFVREFNRLTEKVVPGSSVRSPKEQSARVRLWPMERKDEYADALWNACDMPLVKEFLEEHKPYVTWDDLEDWRRRGHEIGLHTRTHPFCSRLNGREIEAEIVEPARELRERLRLTSVPFAYPFGDRLPQEQEEGVAEMGRLSCLLGIRGLSPQGTPPYHLDRARAESGLNDSVFGRPLLSAVLASRLFRGAKDRKRTPR
jgi:peptidoglycan/xylan/chitin deacetylase (PgdA/CDA1 family)